MKFDDTRYIVHEGCDHIFFVGFLGAGKSTLARNLGEMFHRRYVDTDRLAEKAAGRSLGDIYATDGDLLSRHRDQSFAGSSIKKISLGELWGRYR